MRRFNVTGVCVPEKHYMVDISNKLDKIKEMVDYGDYFTINRARQFGKTTTLSMLKRMLKNEYVVASISFEGLGDESFATAKVFCKEFMGLIQKSLAYNDVTDEYRSRWMNSDVDSFSALGSHITEMCKPGSVRNDKKLILIIDEVDKSSDNRTYLHFLGMLRDKYLMREQNEDYTFHSVILAGVYDIRNIKLKMINEGAYEPLPSENKLYNSPWNIAASFNVDMSFNPSEIASMLDEYETDHNTGMDVSMISKVIYEYTNGYPFMVSRICQCIDTELDREWSIHGVQDAVQILLREKNTLFDDVNKNIENNKNLFDFLQSLLLVGKEYAYNIDDPIIALGSIYGFIANNGNNKAIIANKVFETRIYDYFISKEATSNNRSSGVLQYDVVDEGCFDMELCLRKFAEHYAEIYSERDAEFIEREGRLLFLSYLKPLINGQGFYHIESQFTDLRRMDILVDFNREQFIIELKLWKGEATHLKAYEQLAGYMISKNHLTGYLLTFDFRKNKHEQPYAKWVDYDGVRIFDVVVSNKL